MKSNQLSYFWGALLMGVAVLIGAFGAHGLKKIVSESLLETYQTGVFYHFLHALGLLIIGTLQTFNRKFKLKRVTYLFVAGIFFFSFNCYIYAITQIKFFALLVPIGGTMFAAGWFITAYYIYKARII